MSFYTDYMNVIHMIFVPVFSVLCALSGELASIFLQPFLSLNQYFVSG